MTILQLAEDANLSPKKVSNTQGGEYHSACPSCGGTDRFIIQPDKQQKNCVGYYFCRQCNANGDTIQFAMDYGEYSFNDAINLMGLTIEKTMKSSIFKTPYKPIQKSLEISTNWHIQAAHFLDNAHKAILQNQPILDYLEKRGIPLEAVIKYKLGWSNEDHYYERTDWGISGESKKGDTSHKLWIPSGLIIPIIESEKILRLKVRRHNWQLNDKFPKYIAVSGSMSGLNIIGNKKHPAMIVVETELDAYALHHAVGDFAVIVAVGGSTKNPDAITDYLAKQKILLICPDSDSAGDAMWSKWLSLYPHAINCPTLIGKDIGQAIEHGLDLRSWIIAQIPQEKQYELKLIRRPWSKEDQSLMDWTLNYINKEGANSEFYQEIKKEIELGSESPQAQTRELQDKLSLMKELAEQEYKRRGEL